MSPPYLRPLLPSSSSVWPCSRRARVLVLGCSPPLSTVGSGRAPTPPHTCARTANHPPSAEEDPHLALAIENGDGATERRRRQWPSQPRFGARERVRRTLTTSRRRESRPPRGARRTRLRTVPSRREGPQRVTLRLPPHRRRSQHVRTRARGARARPRRARRWPRTRRSTSRLSGRFGGRRSTCARSPGTCRRSRRTGARDGRPPAHVTSRTRHYVVARGEGKERRVCDASDGAVSTTVEGRRSFRSRAKRPEWHLNLGSSRCGCPEAIRRWRVMRASYIKVPPDPPAGSHRPAAADARARPGA